MNNDGTKEETTASVNLPFESLLEGQICVTSLKMADEKETTASLYLSFKSFLEGEDGSVDGVLQLHVVVVPLLQEGLAVDVVLAHGRRLPCEVSAGRITLE